MTSEKKDDPSNKDRQESANIYQRINAVMNECEYLQKTKAQQGKGIKYDEVIAMIRPLLIKHGIVMVTKQLKMKSLPIVEGTKQRVYQGKYRLRLVNMDNPSDFVEHITHAHGMDGGDKGAGKAHTYAMKTMLVKGFGIETGEDEESYSEKQEKANALKSCISDEQIGELRRLINETNTDERKFLNACNVKDISDITGATYPTAVKMLNQKKEKMGK